MDQVMMQIVENHAEISGTLIDAKPAEGRPGWTAWTVKIDAAHDVAGWPNLFAHNVGQTVEVLVRDDGSSARALPGPLHLRVKKGGPTTIFAE